MSLVTGHQALMKGGHRVTNPRPVVNPSERKTRRTPNKVDDWLGGQTPCNRENSRVSRAVESAGTDGSTCLACAAGAITWPMG